MFCDLPQILILSSYQKYLEIKFSFLTFIIIFDIF